jgi:PTS system nitrogen regulatory IIA component
LAQLFSSRQMREKMLSIGLRDELYQQLCDWTPNA